MRFWQPLSCALRGRAAGALALGAAALGGTPAGAQPVPAATRQLVVVTAPSWASTTGTLRRFARPHAQARWRSVGAPVAVVLGRNGLAWGSGLHGQGRPAETLPAAGGTEKREGDGRAPAGVFALPYAFGYAPALPTRLPYLAADADVECIDDPDSPLYNRIVRRDTVDAAYASHEEMRLAGDEYRRGVGVAHNDAAAPGGARPRGGSCIFLHQWGGPGRPTAGCTAMAPQAIDALVGWLDAAHAPVLVQLPEAAFERLGAAWRLPRLSARPDGAP